MELNPNLQFVETDTEKIKQEVITTVEQQTGYTLAPADPRRIFLETLAYYIGLIEKQQDTTGKMNLLFFSKEDYLEHLAALLDVERLPASFAGAKVKATLSTPLNYSVTIPAGIRITAGNEIYFSITSPIVIEQGTTEAHGTVKCTVAGTIGNGYVEGQINKIVDNLPFLVNIQNTETTTGGEDAEDDEALRERTRQAPESFSTAGPDGSYAFWTKTASPAIVDVAVYSPTPGVVHIRPLLEGGELPNGQLIEEIEKILNEKNRRPLTDKIEVIEPEQVEYNINVKYYINSNDAEQENTLKAAVEKSIREDYVLWQKSALGRDIDPNQLVYFMRGAGAGRIEVTEPVYTEIIKDTSISAATTHKGDAKAQVAKESQITINYGGVKYD
nr:MAG: baseplate J-like protein [Bacteriophage sp.]